MTSFGIALLIAGLFFDNSAPASALQVPTPTIDRLAEPTLPASPSQADQGAQVYWLSCLPCHGDQGQGLTDEFRATYPPEDQNCWQSGCHGKNPYESGFTIPKTIPAVVSPDALANFTDGAQLEAFIQAAMPYWKPGSLTDDETWKVTAFVLRSNGLWDDSTELGPDNASRVKIQRGAASPTPTVERSESESASWSVYAIVIVLPLAAFALFLLMRLRKR